MASRTYVQMYIETGRYNYILKNMSHILPALKDAYQYLQEHPEKVEEVIKQRVFVGRFTKIDTSFQWLFLELQIINSWIFDEKLSFGTMYAVPVKSDYFIPEVHISEANPIYIPKHIKHRRRGRK